MTYIMGSTIEVCRKVSHMVEFLCVSAFNQR